MEYLSEAYLVLYNYILRYLKLTKRQEQYALKCLELEDDEPVTPTLATMPTVYGDVTSICYVDSSENKEALAWGTSNGFLSIVLKLNEDLSKSSNRVETFYIPNKEKINCI